MIAMTRRPTGRQRVLAGVRWGGALLSALALAGLFATSAPGPARAATGPGYDQITGIGETDSAVTVPWTSGLLDASNAAIASANADRSAATPTSPYSFMYADFKSLVVKVSQTKNLGHQGITVSWDGGTPTPPSNGATKGDFLQLMECYGDATTGPTPEQCQYGSQGMIGNLAAGGVTQRGGLLCAAGTTGPSTDPAHTPLGLDGSSAVQGCDPAEPVDASLDVAPCPGDACDNTHTSFSTPFIPVTANGDKSTYAYGPVTTYYAAQNSNEVQLATTQSNHQGQVQFQTLTNVQSPGLGCGAPDPGQNNQARGCWLVIVPRGEYEPNGYKINLNSINPGVGSLVTSPLSAANWAQRIQIHLSYAPLQSFCPPGTLARQTQGTQLILRAMQSWEVALNQQGNCQRIFSFSVPPGEASVTQDLADPASSGVGLGFTTIPVGSEAARLGHPPTTLPSMVYAPIAVEATDFGFNISQTPPPDARIENFTQPVKLTPTLLAKAFTQSYRADLPDYYPEGQLPGPSWAATNPVDISHDQAFKDLNPSVQQYTSSAISLAPFDTEDNSGVNQQIWQWIQSDSATKSWLTGTPDAHNMVIDPAYKALHLDKAPAIDSFPRAYTGTLNTPNPLNPAQMMTRDSVDILPFAPSFNDATAAVLAGNNSSLGGAWDPFVVNPDNTMGAFAKFGIEAPGSIFMWAPSDTPDLAAYGLIPATLCNDAGTTCVKPSEASVSAALQTAVADTKTGVLQVNPATVKSGAWPLTQVIYAAVPTNQDAAVLSDYADLIAYAAGTGQTPGTASGQLPPGYLPLPANLKAKAQAAVTRLRALAHPTQSPTPSPSTTTPTSQPGNGNGNGNGSGNGSGNGTTTPTATPGASATPTNAQGLGATPTTSPDVIAPTVQLAVGTTPNQPVGSIHWALITVLIIGLVGASGGLVLRAGGLPHLPRLPRWPGNWRPGRRPT